MFFDDTAPNVCKRTISGGIKRRKNELAKKILCGYEIGIDLYWDKTHLPQQQIALKNKINWQSTTNYLS
jgi:TatD DNase family protein